MIECNQLRAHEIANKLEALGYQYRGGYGRFCGLGTEIWGHSYAGPNGEYLSMDFTETVATKTVSARIHGDLPEGAR